MRKVFHIHGYCTPPAAESSPFFLLQAGPYTAASFPPRKISCHTGLKDLTLQASEEWAALQSLPKPLQFNRLICCVFLPYHFEMAVGKKL